MPISINFREIRPYNGSQDRAFEELCFQLLPVIEAVPTGTRLVRHGAPDGGVEAIASLPNGDSWAWQAKFLFALTDAEFSQLDTSVASALRSQPALKRYSFFLPYNRPAGSIPGRKSAMERWNEHCRKWQSWAGRQGLSVTFEYFGESELLAALTSPGQTGRVLYWFNATALTPQWFESNVRHAIEVAGPRYTPELSIDLPIAGLFEGLGRTTAFENRLRQALRRIRDSRKWYTIDELRRKAPSEIPDLRLKSCLEKLDNLDVAVRNLDITGETRIDFGQMARQVDTAAEELRSFATELYERARGTNVPNIESGDGEKLEGWSLFLALQSAAYELLICAGTAAELRELVIGEAAQLVNVPALLVVGEAGKGKTHLLCDVAIRRIEAGSPTLMLFGQQFAPGEPWSQILRQLDLSCTVDDFLGALSAAAETFNSKALILIDAINEGHGIDIWQAHLVEFLSRLRRWPRIAIALSCRTEFAEITVPEQLDSTKLIRVVHEGFAGSEHVAANKFFDFYGLALPDFPLLIPEFQTPLFLKIMCQGLAEKGMHTLPRGWSGASSIFDLFLEAVEHRLCTPDKCNFALPDGLVRKAVDELAVSMNSATHEWVSWQAAKDLTERLLPNRVWTKSLLYGLLSEGVLRQGTVPGNGGSETTNAIFFTYQRLSDHLRADATCRRSNGLDGLRVLLDGLAKDESTAYRHSGPIRALSILVPERFGRELHELVPDNSYRPIQQGYLQSLVWRDISSFPQPLPLEYLNQIAQSDSWGDQIVLETLLQVAFVPLHPLNALKLHDHLSHFSMAERDAWWTQFLNHNYGGESQVNRMVEWARSQDSSFLGDDSVFLFSIVLAWFLTSSNRRLRDNSTKGLVALLRQRPSVLNELLMKFNGVNDPYVAERLYAVAYGCALLTQQQVAVAAIAENVYRLVFSSGKPPVHMLLRDYARGVIERAEALGCLPSGVDFAKVHPPYVSRWPITAPSEETLRKRYKDARREYSGLWLSLFTMGDFQRYIVEPQVGKFVAANQRKRKQEARREERRQAKGILPLASVTSEEVVKTFGIEDTKISTAGAENEGAIAIDNKGTQFRIVLCAGANRESDRPVAFGTTLACRWIFSRVVGLGWTPERFGEDDSVIGFGFNRERPSHLERIGKKYQWIALYELLARIADHSPMMPDWNKQVQAYDGPWQVLSMRSDIDPSLMLSSSQRVGWEPACLSWRAPVAPVFPNPATSSARLTWLRNTDDLPPPLKLIRLVDRERRAWLALEGYYTWEEEFPPEQDCYETERCQLWYQIRSYLVRNEHLQRFTDWSKGRNWMGRWMPEAYEFFEVFLGEYPWHPASRSQLRDWEQPGNNGRSIPCPMVVTTARYVRERGTYDHSMNETISGIVPSPRMLELLGLKWSGEDFRYSSSDSQLAAWDPSAREGGPSTLLVDDQLLTKTLLEKELSIVWTVLGEKYVFGPRFSERDFKGRLEVFGVATLQDAEIRLIDIKTNFKAPPRSD